MCWAQKSSSFVENIRFVAPWTLLTVVGSSTNPTLAMTLRRGQNIQKYSKIINAQDYEYHAQIFILSNSR